MGDTERHERERQLFFELNDPATTPTRGSEVRDQLIVMHEPLVRHLCRRYLHPGAERDDILQAGTLGLIAAVDGFDPEHGAAFSSYATPHILGEVRRHLRDETSLVRAPRSVHAARASVLEAADAFQISEKRSPTVTDLVAITGLSHERVLEALEHHRPDFLDDMAGLPEPHTSDEMEVVEYWETVGRALAMLPERERQVLTLRFFDGMSQTGVAQQLGISQMHVSRLQRTGLTRMRQSLGDAYVAA